MAQVPAPAKEISQPATGQSAPNWRVPLSQTTIGPEEEEAVQRVLRRRWLSMGEEVHAFEGEFAAALGAPHAIAVSNGTHGLRMAYEVAGLQPGDAIALPALTFVACLNTALRLGLQPVLLDIESESDWTPSNRQLESLFATTPRLKAVVSMPYAGYAPPMEELVRICRAHKAVLIEDACHAVLGSLGGRSLGCFGQLGVFSFFPNKNMTTGEGGMVVTSDADMAARLRRLRSHGMTTLTWDRHKGHAFDYDVEVAGENFRMDELRAAIGRAQLAKLSEANAARRRTARELASRLRQATRGALKFPFLQDASRPASELASAHLLPALLPPSVPRREFMSLLREKGVQTSIHYPPLDRFSHVRALFESRKDDLPVLRSIESRMVTLPLAPNFDDAQKDHLVESIGNVFGQFTRQHRSPRGSTHHLP